MYLGEVSELGDITSVLNPASSVVGALASIFAGKPSDFRVMLWWDRNAHLAQNKGDKPNGQTIQMSNAVIQGLQQMVGQIESQGGHIDVGGGFATSIGQRDPSYLWYPISPSQRIGDPYHGGPGSIGQLAGPGDPQGVLNGLVQFINAHNKFGALPQQGSAATQPVPGAPLTPQGLPVPGRFSPTAQLPQTIPYPSFAQPVMLPPGGFPQAQASILPDLTPYMPYILGGIGLAVVMSIMKENPAPMHAIKPRRVARRTVHRASRR